MKAGVKPRGRRYPGEAQQEDQSEGQFKARLAEPAVGWPVNRMGRDLGEDLLIQIYDHGTSTGLSFYVQLKSVRDVEQRRRKRGPEELRFRLEVKDLLHWDVQTVPVVLVIWDVEKRSGYWQTIPKIIRALDEQSEGWRKKRTVTVSVPVEQGTDDDGLRRLRWAVADLMVGLVAGRSPFRVTLSFADSEDGTERARAFKQALDQGEPILFEGNAIPELELPDWHRRLYGQRAPVQRVEIRPKPSDRRLPVRVEVQSREGAAVMPYVELRAIKQGTKSLVLSNQHQPVPIVFEVSLNQTRESKLRLWQTRLGSTVQEAREVAAFMFALARPGSRIRISNIETGHPLVDSELPAASHEEAERARIHLETLDKLAFVEPHIAAAGPISVDKGISVDDMVAIDLLYRVCRERRISRIISFSCKVNPDSPDPVKEFGANVELQSGGGRLNLLGREVSLGRVKAFVEDRDRFLSIYRQAILQARSTEKPVEARFDDLRVVMEYLDWPRPADRLYDIASAQAGYFTLAQAAEAGFASAEQVEIEQRVERCGGNVFRLVQYPPSEHEDLVILWLQTDQKGVFSHDTALALHQLSDILPSRRHITVPPGWEPPPDARLDQGTVLHHEEVSPSEITWLSPVPLTKPLRTIRDCIEKGVSPEIIEQAIADALQRGMITKSEAQGLQVTSARSA